MMADEAAFQAWYTKHAKQRGLDPNPDATEHFYDYRAAYRAGAAPDASGHWPSEFKRAGHPNLIVGGLDTRTGQRREPSRTVKGQDIELDPRDGQRVNTLRQIPFTNPRQVPKKGTLGEVIAALRD